MKQDKKTTDAFLRLLDIMTELREKCPWDRKQTMESLRHLTIEETYELAEAILEKDHKQIKNELGDLLLHFVFYCIIAKEEKTFTMADVITGLCEKLIHRHPHIYGNVKADSAEQVKKNWEKLKLKEGKKSILEGIPPSLPALIKAYRIQEKAKTVGFEWETTEQVYEKVIEEFTELKEEVNNKTDRIEDEYGDLLFALINYARFIGVNPENALEKTNRKFISRFQYIEKEAEKEGKNLSEMTLQEMDELWETAKRLSQR